MKRFLKNVSLRRKLLVIIMLTSSVALLVASAAFVASDWVLVRQSMVHDLTTLAAVLGQLNTAALDFNDPNSAQESLDALRDHRAHIMAACIYDRNGRVFVRYLRPGMPAGYTFPKAAPPGFKFSQDSLEVFGSVVLQKEAIGSVYLRSDLEALYTRVYQYSKIVGLVIAGSLGVALLLSALLQRVISVPILDLSRTMKIVSEEKNFSVRAEKNSEDELGQLTEGFNEMLSQIQSRDAALQQAHDELEKRVDERTRELQQEIVERKQVEMRLRALASQLERSNRELQDFAYVASHDLQEPLRKVQAFGDRLRSRYNEQLGADGRDFLDRMQNAARRMQDLINDLLVFSRVTTKAQPFEQVSLKRVVREVLGDLEVRVQQSNAQIAIEDLPVIEADPTQMRQLFQNLLSNALKFHKPGQPPVIQVSSRILKPNQISALGVAREDEALELCVRDHGIGFDEKYLDRIFAVFQRLHGRTTYEGTGIGLAICRKIAERHGGMITARSAPGEGAAFLALLPLRQSKKDVL